MVGTAMGRTFRYGNYDYVVVNTYSSVKNDKPSIKVLELDTGKIYNWPFVISPYGDWIILVSPNNKYLLIIPDIDGGNNIFVFKILSPSEIEPLYALPVKNIVDRQSIAFHPEKNLAATWIEDRSIAEGETKRFKLVVWELETGKIVLQHICKINNHDNVSGYENIEFYNNLIIVYLYSGALVYDLDYRMPVISITTEK
jgi:WD40 repeat protein